MARKRRTFSSQFKVDTVMELLTDMKSPSEICRDRKITDKLLYRWKAEFLERLPGVFEGDTQNTTDSQERIAELERMVGRLALENEVLKNAESWHEAHRRRKGK